MTIPLFDLHVPQRTRRAFRFRNQRRFELESLESRRVMATLIAGQVVDDLNANGAIDAGEPGQANVTVYIDYNGNDQLDLEGTVIEPDEYADGEVIDASAKGVSFSVVDADGIPVAEAVVAHVDDWGGKNYASTGELVFARKDSFVTESFFYDEARLRMDFDPPVFSVQIDYTGTRLADAGVMRAYTEDGTLIDGYQTSLLSENVTETMEVVSGEANIAYVLAHDQWLSLNGRLDALRINAIDAEPWTLTNGDGDYSLFVDDGATYSIKQVVPDGFAQSLPVGGEGYDVVIDVGQTVSGINFANNSTTVGSWQNPINPLDVYGNDGFITPTDVIFIVNELNQPKYSHPITGLLSPPPAVIPAYYDVDGDGSVTPTDVITVVNYLNSHPSNGGGGEGEPSDLTSSAVAAAVDERAVDDAEKTCAAADTALSNTNLAAPPRQIDAQTVESVFSGSGPIWSIAAAVMDDDTLGEGLAAK